MKHVFLALAVLCMGAVAQAEQQDICSKGLMVCGNYEGTGNWYDISGKAQDGGFLEKINIKAVDANTLNIEVFIYGADQKPEDGWTLSANLVFKNDGQFEYADKDGDVHAAGFCTNGVCNVSFRPVPYTQGSSKGKINAFTDTLRFADGKLYRYNMVTNSSADVDFMIQRSTLTKK